MQGNPRGGRPPHSLDKSRELAVTVIGHDRTGIIADVADTLAGLGFNLTDSTMTRLRGHFAMTLVCTGGPAAAEVEAALGPLTVDGQLATLVREMPAEQPDATRGVPHVLTVHGTDRLGIVAGVTRAVAEFGGNVTDLTTRLSGDLYVLVAEVDLPGEDVDRLAERLAAASGMLGVDIGLRLADPDVL
jgi:glycine cleavage system transcriptional repressor